MKIRILVFLITLTAAFKISAQDSVNGSLDVVILEQANTMGRYFIAKDYEAFAKFTHPATVELIGGEAILLQQLKEAFGALEDEGVTFLKISFTAPSQIITYNGELQCTLTQIIEMKVTGGVMTAFSALIAVSRNGGKNWYFADTAGNDLKNMRKLITTLSPNLVLPEPMEPGFVPDPEEKQ